MTPIRQELATAIRHRDAAKAELDRFDEQLASMRWRKSEAQARLDAIKADRVVLVDKYMDDRGLCLPAGINGYHTGVERAREEVDFLDRAIVRLMDIRDEAVRVHELAQAECCQLRNLILSAVFDAEIAEPLRQIRAKELNLWQIGNDISFLRILSGAGATPEAYPINLDAAALLQIVPEAARTMQEPPVVDADRKERVAARWLSLATRLMVDAGAELDKNDEPVRAA